MKQDLYHQLNPYVRLKETEILAPNFYEQLIASDLPKIKELLMGTVYGKYITEDFPNNFDAVLNQELLASYSELVERAPKPEVVFIFTMRFTLHNLKVLTKAYYIGENYDHLYLPDGFYDLDELKHAIETGKSAVLPPSILKSIHEVKAYLAESAILQGIDVIYDRRFLKEQRRLGEEIGYPELLKEIVVFIDLTNIITALRCLLQKRTQAFLTAVLSSSGSIPKETYLDFAQKDVSSLRDYLLTTEYGDLLSPALRGDEIDFSQLDKIKDNRLTELFASAQTEAFGPLPLLAYLNAKEVETKNLRLIITGKKSGFTNEQIKERMRMTYDI
ncbi:V-type ATPase subunit C [Enterococcus saigonensis]|uniref:V-type ATPase subunit C n=1 Tax=Enterococcus saigonensis TaxID=1805431 RepID=A0A679II64_9ENTE|nr:V-type ATPase subunit [Enterococcus saigonensis]BCA85692.1 V-type ATPase subunit C [Enterococcus saigonensis]